MSDQVAIFGDCHGQSGMLEELLIKIRDEAPKSQIYTCGDLIDRGPDSYGVIDLCIKYEVKGCYGNHEIWMKSLVEDRVFDSMALTKLMGGKETFRSYSVMDFSNETDAAIEFLDSIPQDHKDYLKSLKPYLKIEVDGWKYWLIHAGLSNKAASYIKSTNDDISDDELMRLIVSTGSCEDFLMWPSPPLGNRFRPSHGMYVFKEGTQILGHKPLKSPIVNNDFIALDTGCGTCHPNKISAILLPSKKIIQVENEYS